MAVSAAAAAATAATAAAAATVRTIDETCPLLSAHVITSDVTRGPRERLIQEFTKIVEPMCVCTPTIVEAHNALELRERLSQMAATDVKALLDLNPESLDDKSLRPLVSPMHVRTLSNVMKHHQAVTDAAKCHAEMSATMPQEQGQGQQPKTWSLVIEDDAVFNTAELRNRIERVLASAPIDADLVFLGLPSKRDHSSDDIKSVACFDAIEDITATQILPACDSYLIASSAVERLADGFLPIRFGATAQLTYLIRKGVVKAYISVPNVFVDGSKLGHFTSSLNPNNLLIWNQPYCNMAIMLNERKTDGFEAIWDAQTDLFRSHPDALVLRADWHMACDRPKDAERTYEEALKAYEANGCIVGAGSEFLKRYIAVYGKM